MDTTVQHDAQQRADRIAVFKAELALLERDQVLVLTEQQRSSLDEHLSQLLDELAKQFGVDVSESARRLSWVIRIATLLGGAAFFASLVLFLHRIWGSLPESAYAPLLVAFPIILLVSAEVLCRAGVHAYYTALLAVAGIIAFMMELSTLGSVLNMGSSPNAVLAWSIVAVLLAYAYGIRLLLAAGIVLFCAFSGALCVSIGGGYWESFPERAGYIIPAAAAVYLIPPLLRRDHHRFNEVYRACGAALALGSLFIMSQVGYSYGLGLSTHTVEFACQLSGLGLSAAVVLHGLRLAQRFVVNTGALGFVVFLFVRLHAWWWDWMPKYLFFLLIGLIAIALLIVFRRMRANLAKRGAP
jgi:hypothetical protein